MILTAIILVFIKLVGLLVAVFPVVTALPFGIDEALVFMVNTFKALVEIMPWMQTPLSLMLLAVSIQMALYLWTWIKWLLQLVRG